MFRQCFLILTLIIAFPTVSGCSEDNPPVEAIKTDANDWPWWRGPNRNGVAAKQNPPMKWSATENVLWKAEVPGRGHGSPTIVGDHVYLATAEEKEQIQSVLCFASDTGRQLWKKVIHKGGFETKGNKRASHASCSVACDGKRLFVNFNHKKAIYTTALDLQGNQLWQTKITDYVTHQGYGASPMPYGSLVLVSADNKGGGVVKALHRSNGNVVWEHDRPKTPNYVSPMIHTIDGKDRLFLCGCNLVSCLEPETGKLLWEVKGSTTECVTSIVTDGESIFTSGGYPKNHVAAYRVDQKGKVLWDKGTRVYVPSMLVHEGHLYAVMDAGFAVCWDCKTGEEKWKSRLGGTFNASLVLVGDSLFATNQNGQTFIFKATPKEFELVEKNQLGRDVFATPSICGDRIYFRVVAEGKGRQEMLYCVGKK